MNKVAPDENRSRQCTNTVNPVVFLVYIISGVLTANECNDVLSLSSACNYLTGPEISSIYEIRNLIINTKDHYGVI
jgi:hypothetical protein